MNMKDVDGKFPDEARELLARVVEHNSRKQGLQVYIAQSNKKLFSNYFLKSQVFGYKSKKIPKFLFELKTEGIIKNIEPIPTTRKPDDIWNQTEKALQEAFTLGEKEIIKKRSLYYSDRLPELYKLDLDIDTVSTWLSLGGFNKEKAVTSSASPNLVSSIPFGGKYKALIKIAKLFEKQRLVRNYLLARCITPTIRNQSGLRKRLTRVDYESNKGKWDQKIKNCFRSLKKYIAPLGYTIKFHSQQSELISPK